MKDKFIPLLIITYLAVFAAWLVSPLHTNHDIVLQWMLVGLVWTFDHTGWIAYMIGVAATFYFRGQLSEHRRLLKIRKSEFDRAEKQCAEKSDQMIAAIKEGKPIRGHGDLSNVIAIMQQAITERKPEAKPEAKDDDGSTYT